MTSPDFDHFCNLIKERSGIVLNAEKSYLIESRLGPIASQLGHKDVNELLSVVRSSRDENLLRTVTDALTTNESFFFRDNTPFDLFKEVMLPDMLTARASRRRLRIWCAACSSGQEPYSLAMILKEMGPDLDGWNIEIVGTDISHGILERAKDGVFSQFEVQRGLPAKLLVKYFEKDDANWRIKDEIRKMVDFRFLNLVDNPQPLGTFDIVFCRNVLIYFDIETKQKVLQSIARVSERDAYLVLGAAETMIGITQEFKMHPERRGLYQVAQPDEVAA